MKEEILKALEYIKQVNWHEAHEIAQSKEGQPDYDRIHALLHRIEGDDWNTKYWYQRCSIPFPTISTEQETIELIDFYSKK